MGTCVPGFPSAPSAPGMPREPWKESLISGKQNLVAGCPHQGLIQPQSLPPVIKGGKSAVTRSPGCSFGLYRAMGLLVRSSSLHSSCSSSLLHPTFGCNCWEIT